MRRILKCMDIVDLIAGRQDATAAVDLADLASAVAMAAALAAALAA
jgi:hypothetical protein